MRVGDTRVTGVAWHPQGGLEPGVLALAAGGWSVLLRGTPCVDVWSVCCAKHHVCMCLYKGHLTFLQYLLAYTP